MNRFVSVVRARRSRTYGKRRSSLVAQGPPGPEDREAHALNNISNDPPYDGGAVFIIQSVDTVRARRVLRSLRSREVSHRTF